MPLVIAGNKPSASLVQMVAQHPHITLLQNATTQKINELTQQAQINVLPTFQSTGIKLKLINVLFQGRWVLANQFMVENTGLASLCEVANTAAEMKTALKQLINQEFTPKHIAQRNAVLAQNFSNSHNIMLLKSLL